jgi:branched-chain amino acid transport system ATP-binding protein
MTNRIVLETYKLNVSYGIIPVLRDVTIKVNEDEILTVLGPNGSGKSTLLRTIAGLLRPSSGLIKFQSQRINGYSPHKITELGISLVPEGRRLFPSLSVLENLRIGAYTAHARKNLEEVLKQVFDLFPILKERKDQKAGTLSGGEQQMLAIGRALMSQPRLLMIDEPSSGLSPKVAKKVISTLKELNVKTGLTVLLVEQNVKMALEIANRGYVIENGTIVLEGEAEVLKSNEHVKEAYLGM